MPRQEEKPAFAVEQRRHPVFRRFISVASIAGIVLILIVLFFALPNLLISSSSFCGLCHDRDHKTWSVSTHKNVGCVTCHAKRDFRGMLITGLGLTQKVLIKVGAAEGVRPAGFDGSPTHEVCDPCHKVRKNISPSGDLLIPHQAHTQLRKIACVDCHKGLVHRVSSEKRNRTSMLGCYRCHDGRKAANSCSACHTEKALPEDHRADNWLMIHSQVQEQNPAYCEDCHGWVEDYCSECHRRKPRSHRAEWPGWRAKHQELILSDRSKGCGACHGDMCKSCHPR